MSKEHVLIDKDCASLQAQLESLRMQISGIDVLRVDCNHNFRRFAQTSSKQDEKEDMVETSNVALKEHVPIDKDCASLQAQLESLRMQISGIDVLRVDCQSQFSTIRSNALNP